MMPIYKSLITVDTVDYCNSKKSITVIKKWFTLSENIAFSNHKNSLHFIHGIHLPIQNSMDREMVKTKQYHHSSNSDLEDSTVTPFKNGYYVPVSALCAESTMDKILFKTLLVMGAI